MQATKSYEYEPEIYEGERGGGGGEKGGGGGEEREKLVNFNTKLW